MSKRLGELEAETRGLQQALDTSLRAECELCREITWEWTNVARKAKGRRGMQTPISALESMLKEDKGQALHRRCRIS